MSMLLMVKVLQAKIGSPARKLVLLKLADNANDKGECWPSYQNIADHCEMSRRSIITHITNLKKLGFISIENRKTLNGYTSNMYRLTISSKNISLGGENISPGGGENISPRISHSFEPVNEPLKIPEISKGDKPKTPYKKIVALYNEILPELEPVNFITEKRKKSIKRLFEYHEAHKDLSWWEDYFKLVSQSNFLTGRVHSEGKYQNWKCSFNFLVDIENFVKVIEGGYT